MKKHILKQINQHKYNLITNLQYLVLLCQTENRCSLQSLIPQNQMNLQNQKLELLYSFIPHKKKNNLENRFAFNNSVVISSVFSGYKHGSPKIIHNSERSHTFPFCIRATFFSNETLRQGASYEIRIEVYYQGLIQDSNLGSDTNVSSRWTITSVKKYC